MTADTRQTIYIEENHWRPPEGAEELPLAINLRSTRSVAKVISHLGGPKPLDRAPAGLKTVFLKAGGTKEVVKRVRRRVTELVTDFGVPHSEILVLTTRKALRDALRESSNDELRLVAWEQRDEGVVACETVHRTKGLEATAVILATLDDPVDDQLVYVGASRAIWSLTLVGREEFAALCGVDA
jgi:DNA helicase IV